MPDGDKQSLAEHGNRAIAKLRALSLIDLSEIHLVKHVFAATVYPIYVKSYREALHDFLSQSLRCRRLLLLGRQGLYSHINIDDVIWKAFAAADLIALDPFDDEKKREYYGAQMA